ncbi:M15 family metallopeptidase [Planococcus sp. SE5232]|uniref:M15 family metallopeptidase n=1 Tax=unclassified Planococcus (in: firmicutes) TaxID=2662419 RepID=UPI003D6C003A
MARVSVFTLIERSVNNMGAINPKVKDLAVELVIRSYHIGIYVQITSGLRTYAQQTKLYNQGRTTSGNVVTNAKAGQSIHNFGLAIDYVLVSEDGDTAYWDINRNMNGNQVRDWFEVAAIGKQLGFAWGGDWKSFKDYPHLDMQKGYSLATLRSGSRPSIPGVPKRDYQGVGDSGSDVMKTQQNLTKAGYKCTEDGYYGEGTEEVVKKFQRANGLTDDGFYGSSSVSKMAAVLRSPATPSVQKPPANVSTKPEEEIYMAELLKLTTGEGKNAQLRVLKRFEKKDPALSDSWRKKVEEGTLTINEGLEIIYVAIDRGYITGLVDTTALQERVESLEETAKEKIELK